MEKEAKKAMNGTNNIKSYTRKRIQNKERYVQLVWAKEKKSRDLM